MIVFIQMTALCRHYYYLFPHCHEIWKNVWALNSQISSFSSAVAKINLIVVKVIFRRL